MEDFPLQNIHVKYFAKIFNVAVIVTDFVPHHNAYGSREHLNERSCDLNQDCIGLPQALYTVGQRRYSS